MSLFSSVDSLSLFPSPSLLADPVIGGKDGTIPGENIKHPSWWWWWQELQVCAIHHNDETHAISPQRLHRNNMHTIHEKPSLMIIVKLNCQSVEAWELENPAQLCQWHSCGMGLAWITNMFLNATGKQANYRSGKDWLKSQSADDTSIETAPQ